jgi:hypothetical protein
MNDLNKGLTTAGTVIGVLVILYALARYLQAGSFPALLIALAILIVGPGEDLLERWVRRTAPTPEDGEARAITVDRVTSIVFLVLLGGVVYLL